MLSVPYIGPAARQAWHAYIHWQRDPTRMISRVLGTAPDIIIVQVGSNDGKTADPIRQLLVANPSWRALFVEPVPYVFERLCKNYGNNPRFTFANVAISASGTTLTFYYLAEDAKAAIPGLPVWYDQVGSFNRQHISKHFPGHLIDQFIVEAKIPCLTLSELFVKNNISRLDILHIDTEGFDWEILQQLDLNTFEPTIILFEHSHLSPESRAAARSFLASRYRITEYRADWFCQLRVPGNASKAARSR